MHQFQVRLLCCAAATAMLSGAPETARSAPNAAAPDTAARTVAPAGPGGVLVSFKGGQVTVADLQASIANKDAISRARLAGLDERKRFLDQLVNHDLLVLEAERRGFAQHAAVLDAGKRAAIDAMLARDLAVDPASIPAAEVTAHFTAHRDQYARPALRRASHIEVASEAEARALLAELKGATREKFSKVAVERSRGARTRRQGGELGYFDAQGNPRAGAKSGDIAKELAAAAFALGREGAIAPRPIAHGDGFSVLMLTGEMEAIEPRFAEIEPTLRAELAAVRAARAEEELLAKLRAQATPEVHPELLAAIEVETGKKLDQPQGYPAAPPDPRAPTKIVEPDGF